MDRRTFLANGLKTGAILAASGAAVEAIAPGAASAQNGGSNASVGGRAGSPRALKTTGVESPVGVDPDDVRFAWQLTDRARGAVQGAYRIVLSRPGSSERVVWDSGEVPSRKQAFVPYSGPALQGASRFSWTVRTADEAGEWSEPAAATTFTTGLRQSDWTAQWLRPGPEDPGVEEYTYLRTEKALPPGKISYATAYVAAAHKYQLWVNGSIVDSGPSFCFPDEQYYQATDVTDALVAGRANVIGVLHHWYGPGRGRPTSAPGLLVQVAVRYHDGKVFTIASDGTWTTHRAEWMPAPQRNNDSGDFVEWIDGRLRPEGWSEVGFDDQAWQPAAVLGPVGTPPFTRLFAQRTRISELKVGARSVRTLPTGSVVVDFGKVYAGRPTVAFHHGVEGHTVPMHVGYTLDPDGSVSTTHNTQGTDLSFSYIQKEGAQTFEPFWYLGFRYLQVDEPGEALSSGAISLVARHATMPDGPNATFVSSNKTLDEVWDLCAHSGLYTSQEQFIDTPTREKGQFLWDAANESQTVMRVYGEQNLSWQGLRDMARAQVRYWPTGQVNEVYPNDDGPQNYPTFTALYPEWVWRYYLSTGDSETVVGLLPTLSRLSDYLVGVIDASTGLISGQPMSTNGDNEYGYDYNTNADTTLNILATNSFRRIGQVAALAGNAQLASVQSQRADALTGAVNSLLVRGDGVYVDGLRSNGQQSAHASQLANLTALAYGVAPASRLAIVGEYVASLDISVEPDHGMELLRALHAAGRDGDVLRILTDSSFPGWAAILKAGGTFTWETWTPSDLIGDSMSHGWGSSALVAIQESLLGVVPAPPEAGGASTVLTVSPPSGVLRRASGSFPTPAGQFSVSWRESGGGSQLTLSVPPNAAARCTFPLAQISEVTESGVQLTRAAGVTVLSSTPGRVTAGVGAGNYDFAWRYQ
ncbi:MAG TPA: family 78 glycoside hydrolase catalytic domain [Acidimicrobiales bacterium]|nr:family 78 glycoside hydrolase catalytic domain [Acidimicrobiales bacterium]